MQDSNTQSPKVGVVIAIYNVEKYLGECLDSVVSQTYKNMEVLLVNDGSTDSSLEICKEYVAKYTHFTLIDKPNLGLSSTRNVGIEYFSKDYMFKKDSKDSNLIAYKIQNANPYNIKSLYKSSLDSIPETFQAQDIEYIIFLDSDDFWDSKCIESCVRHSKGVEIVWFLINVFCDGVDESAKPKKLIFGELHKLGIGKITRDEWMRRCKELEIQNFYFSWAGLIDFRFLKSIRLKYVDEVVNEDEHFGTLLFVQAKHIYLLNEVLYHYRIRPGSIMSFGGEANTTEFNVPPHILKIYKAFDNDIVVAKSYHKSASIFLMLLAFNEFFNTYQDSKAKEFITSQFFPFYLYKAAQIFDFKKDPWDIIDKMPHLNPNIKPKDRRMKVAMKSPTLYKKTKILLQLYRSITNIERSIRKAFKKKK